MNLEREFRYFEDNQADLVAKFPGRYIVIRGESVVGDYASELEAYIESKKKYDVGTFLIQQCLPGSETTTQTFHSRVSFAPL
jgi:hypothetical protein